MSGVERYDATSDRGERLSICAVRRVLMDEYCSHTTCRQGHCMAFGTYDLQDLIGSRRRIRTDARATLRAGLIGAMCLVGVAFLFTAAPAAAQAQEAAGAPPGTLVKFVILSRHGVRSPTLDPKELDTWTESKWPSWACATGACARGELTPRGQELAMQMGTYYRRYLSSLLPETPDTPCPGAQDLFVWPDVSDERTRDTALGLLQGFRPACDPGRYIRTQTPSDPIFHSIVQSNCRLDATRAEQEINGNLSKVVDSLRNELALAQEKLQCCKPELCQKVGRGTGAGTQLPPPNIC